LIHYYAPSSDKSFILITIKSGNLIVISIKDLSEEGA